MTIEDVFAILIDVLLLPLQLILAPIDALLAQIPDIELVPDAILGIVGYVSTIPELLVSVTGLSPFLWNALVLTFLLYMGAAPAINLFKRIWAWLRP